MAKDLPIHAVLATLQSALQTRDEVVLQAPPGAGKTTIVPLCLLNEAWLGEQKIVVLEPRRLAARAAAERMASLLGESVGERVGYRVRLDSKVSARTRIEVVTEGILTRQLQNDPGLNGIGVVIFDEFHERSVEADLGLALASYGRALMRDGPSLKLIVMSATLDGTAVAELLDKAPVISSEGRSYPVDIRYVPTARAQHPETTEVVAAIMTALNENTGSVLVFLPGRREIGDAASALGRHIKDDRISVHPLYGNLSLRAQREAIAPPAPGCRKVVLSTDIAQTSLTIEGVSVVVDSGLSRRAAFDPRTAMTRLKTVRVSRADADQRAGRAGRTSPGLCYRLWSDAQHRALGAFTPPEIAAADLSSLALQMLKFGVSDPLELSWLDPPKAALWQQAIDLLFQFNAVTAPSAKTSVLTAHGERMAMMPVHPRLAHLLIKAREASIEEIGSHLCALLTSRDPLTQAGTDIELRLRTLQTHRQQRDKSARTLNETRQLSQRFMRLCETLPAATARIERDCAVAYLLALAYPDRVARRRDSATPTYQLANGRSARLKDSDALVVNDWLVVADVGGRAGQSHDIIYLAARFDADLLTTSLAVLVSEHDYVAFDARKSRLVAERQERVGQLVWRRRDLKSPSVELKRQALIDYIAKTGLSALPFDDTVNQWRARIALLRDQDVVAGKESEWPDVSDTRLLQTLDDWLGPFLNTVTHVNHFSQLDIKHILANQLSWPQSQQLDALVPVKIAVPSGSKLMIDYLPHPPVLAVKLQEMFGCTTTPTVANGVALTLHLLSPAGRPIQVTQDLAGFWQGSYIEVQKEMKGRYPKHYWPDDPLAATPSHRSTKKPR